jgi:hypothetical protein
MCIEIEVVSANQLDILSVAEIPRCGRGTSIANVLWEVVGGEGLELEAQAGV